MLFLLFEKAKGFATSQFHLESDEGQTTVEYAIIVALVLAMAVAVFPTLSSAIGTFMTSIASAISLVVP